MKKLVLLLPLVLSINCFSQIRKPITKGNIIIEGGGTFQYQKDQYMNGLAKSKTNLYFITLNPGAGYFIIDNLAVGLNATLYYNGAASNKYYTLGIGPMVRYYFENGIFLKADADYSFMHNISSNGSDEKFFSVIPGAGYAFFLNSKVSLEPAICYEFDNMKLNTTSTHKINSIRLELKLSVFL